MRDRRVVDDLTIEELEEVLRIKKREARLERLKKLEESGRRRSDVSLAELEGSSQRAAAPPVEHQSFLQEEKQEKRSARDRLLVGIEVISVFGVIAILVFAAVGLREINQQSAEAQAAQIAELPTPTATPLLTAVVLPGGHTPPTAPGGAQPNYSEVPAELIPLVEQQFEGPLILPTPAPENAVRIRIPAIGVDAPVVQGDSWAQLQKGVGQHIGTANPGESGNVVLSAHNDIFGEIFRRIDQLTDGDEIIVQTQTREYVYIYVWTEVVKPTEVRVMEQTVEPIVTLISCYPYLINNERIVVVGELVN